MNLSSSSSGHYTTQCEDPSNSTLWADVDNDSTIELGRFTPAAAERSQAAPAAFL